MFWSPGSFSLFFPLIGIFPFSLGFNYVSGYCSCTIGNPNHGFVVYSQNFRINLRLKTIYNGCFTALAFKLIRSEDREDQWKAVFTLVQGTLKSCAKPVEFFNNVFSYTPSNVVAKQGNGQTFELVLCLLITHFCTGLSPNSDP